MEILVTNKRGKVMEFFLRNPARETHLRELSRLLNISFPWVRKVVSILVKEHLLLREKRHKLVLVRANRDSELFRALKRSHNLFSLYSSGMVAALAEAYGRPEAVVLFGSYSRGEDTEASDVDIAILTSRQVSLDVSAFEKKLQRKIRIHELKRERVEKEFWNTLANGIVISGYLELP